MRYTAVLWAIGLGMPMMASAGWMIEQIEYANLGAEGTRTLQYISKNRLKTVGDGNTFIMDFAKNLFIATDQENRVYWSGTVDAYVQEVKTFQQAANELAREQMEEAVKEMAPDQRKSMEDLLQQMRSANASSLSPPSCQTTSGENRADPRDRHDRGASRHQDHGLCRRQALSRGVAGQGLDAESDLDLKRLRGIQAQLTQAIMAGIQGRQAVEEEPAYEQITRARLSDQNRRAGGGWRAGIGDRGGAPRQARHP